MDQHHLLTTFALAASLGVFLLILSARIKVSAIVVLLIGGILAGPEFLGLVQPETLGQGMNTIISIAVGLILFEGGLTLDIKGYRQVSAEIWGVLTAGVLVTWLTTAVILKLVFPFDWAFCLLSASLIIVTGPTVIGPLLSRIRVRKNLHHILHWEGVLIDPIGVFIALLCFDYYISAAGAEGTVLLDFFLRFAVGAVLGLIFGLLVHVIIKRNWIQDEYLNIFVLACAILNFAVADTIKVESGLLSVTVAGLVVGSLDTPKLSQIVTYKVELKDFLIGLLFVLLAANLELVKFTQYGLALGGVVLAVMFVVRPINIFLSTRKSSLQFREKLFLSWIAPRGIVAASMASLFALGLTNEGNEHAVFLETFTYSVIAGTVIFQGFTAGAVGRLLGVLEPKPTGWIVVGAHAVARKLAHFIEDNGFSVVLIDSNPREASLARREGLIALCVDAMAIDPEHYVDFYGCGNFVALTGNENLNRLLCQRWDNLLDDANLYRWEEDAVEEGRALPSMGTAVWHGLALSYWMSHGEVDAPIRSRSLTGGSKVDPDKVLLTLYNGDIIMGPPEDHMRPATLLTLEEPEPESQEPTLPTRPEWVVFSQRQDLKSLYSRMLSLTAEQAPQLDRDTLLSDLLTREEEFTSLLGHGISMPHAYSPHIEEALLLVARAKTGIPCKHTGSDIDIVFMLLSPLDQPSEHLGHISHIARLIGKETNRRIILEADTPEELYEAITNH
ncbi:MAG: cation:proton antiporter [Acidobacteriota bacterium]|nr:cation:proton antiporter [Acidobacteriota bacterium]